MDMNSNHSNASFKNDGSVNSNGNNGNLAALLLAFYNSTDSMDAQLFAIFHDTGPQSQLIVPALYLSCIALVGIPLNLGIIYTTLRHRKTLNRNANYLIALNAFFDMLQLSHPLPFLFIALSGQNFVGSFQSMRLILPALFGIQASLTCIACTGVDRLLSVLLPIYYQKMRKLHRQFYFSCHTALCVANGAWNAAGLWFKCAAKPDRPVTGFIGQIGWNSSKDLWHYLVGPVLIWLTIACYIAIGLIMCIRKRRTGLNESNGGGTSTQQKLLKSLAIIVGVHVGTSLFGSVLLGFTSHFSAITTWNMQCFSLCTILLGACSNAVVLYMNSTEYRLLFNVGLAELKALGARALKVTQAARIFPASSSQPQQTNSRSTGRTVSDRTMAI